MNKNVLYKVLSSGSTRFVTAIGSIIFTALIPVYFGLEDLGEFTIALSIVLGLSLICRFGFDKYILRITGSNDNDLDTSIKELVSVALIVSFVCLVVGIIILGLQNLTDFTFLETKSFNVLKFCLFPLSINQVFSNYLNGIGKQEWAPFFEPSASSAAAALFFIFMSLGFFTEYENVLYCWAIYTYLTFFLLLGYLGFNWKPGNNFKKVKNTLTSNYIELKNYFLSSISSYVMSLGIYPVMGISLSDADVGIFRLFERIVGFLNFILIIVNNIFAPRFAFHWTRNESLNVRKAYFESLKLVWLLSVPATILIYFFWDEILGKIFQIDIVFTESSWVFNILLLGTFINVGFGGVLLLLDMTKHHKITKNISLSMTVIGILGIYFLSSYFGLIGSAIAYLVFIFGLNILAYYYTRKKIINRL